MKKVLFFVIACILITASAYAIMGDEPDRTKVDLPEAASKVLPDNGDAIASVKADLNGDGKDDFLVAFEYLNSDRELLVIVKTGKGYKIAGRSMRAILCKECGGVYGDPFVRIWAEKKKFGIDHFGGSNFKWSNNSEFGYSRRDKKWQLVKFDSAEYDLELNTTEKHFTPADFGLINLEMFDINKYMSEGTIEPVPDEQMIAASEQQTAVSEAQTAEITAKYTPTPLPTHVYTKPEQLQHAELITMAGGEFTQSDGKIAFRNTLSPFKIGKYPVTYELWYVVKVWAEKNGYKFELPGEEKRYRQNQLPTKDSLNPVNGISRRDAIVWCNAYSQMTKLKPVYCSDKGMKNPIKSSVFGEYNSTENKAKGGFDNPYVDWQANGYRLPTEAEWLYAITYIDGQDWLDTVAYSNDPAKTQVVYEAGKLSEWLWDFYADYPAVDKDDYRGPEPGDSPAGAPNVLHGGTTDISAVNPGQIKASVGQRIQEYPMVGDIRNGFRVARTK